MSGSDWCIDMQGVPRLQPDLALPQPQPHLYDFNFNDPLSG